jgi:hypothetical protein
MFNRLLLLCVLSLLTTAALAQSSAPSVCPWMTIGTAAKALGGEVSVAVKVSDAGEGSCSFSRIEEPAAFLKVEVSKTSLPACSAESTRLKGIGNEALRCKLSAPASQNAEMISSRVREVYFTVVLNPSAKTDPPKASDAQDDALEQVAEIVAGSLF